MKNILLLGASVLFLLCGILIPQIVSAQSYTPTAELIVTTQMQNGSGSMPSSPTVTVIAPGASITSNIPSSIGSIQYASNFNNDTRDITFIPGTYSVSVSPVAGYVYTYSPGCNGTISSGGGAASCIITAEGGYGGVGSAQLTVYTTINNNDNTYSYGESAYAPSSVAISVSGDDPMPANFAGSSSGTTVTIAPGDFSVTAAPIPGWALSQSGTCSGFIGNGQDLSCTLTYAPEGTTTQYPFNQYGNYLGPLTCMPSYQQVEAGQTATFTAQGGSGAYSWGTATQSINGVGPILNVVLQGSGIQTVAVSSGSQTASCSVDVLGGAYIAPPTATTGGYVVAGLPNTGFQPQNGSALAFALVGLIAAGVLVFPYVRIALSALLG